MTILLTTIKIIINFILDPYALSGGDPEIERTKEYKEYQEKGIWEK